MRLRCLQAPAGVVGEPSQQRAQVLTAAFAEIVEQRGELMRRNGRGFREPRIVAILTWEQCQHDPALAREHGEPVDAVAPPVDAAEQAYQDHLGMCADAVDPEIDRHRMAQVAQMREPYARQRVAFDDPRRGKPG